MSGIAARVVTVVLFLSLTVGPAAGDPPASFLDQLTMNTLVASTVPGNGDVNPYGVAVVPTTVGKLVAGNVLVSNFNNSANLQGTGSTIVQIAPDGTVSTFAEITPADLSSCCPCPGGIGLTTALVALSSGWVIVGSLPTVDGTSATAQAGCLLILNSNGRVVEVLSGDLIDGPWDMTAYDGGCFAMLFVANVLNGTLNASPNEIDEATIVRITLIIPQGQAPFEVARTVIGSGFGEITDPAALVIGPTGLGLGADGTLYVADTLAARIAAIDNALFRKDSAGIGRTVSQSGFLNSPLGLTIAPNGNIIVANGGDGNLVEVTPVGAQIAEKTVDRTGTGAGSLFGLAAAPEVPGIYYVNDADNTLNLLSPGL